MPTNGSAHSAESFAPSSPPAAKAGAGIKRNKMQAKTHFAVVPAKAGTHNP
jgi:hypothetical protein